MVVDFFSSKSVVVVVALVVIKLPVKLKLRIRPICRKDLNGVLDSGEGSDDGISSSRRNLMDRRPGGAA